MIRSLSIAVLDMHPLIRAALARLAATRLAGCTVVEAGSWDELRNHSSAVHLCTIDPAQPGVGGPSSIVAVTRAWKGVRVVVVTDHDSPDYVMTCRRRGAVGFVSKRAPLDTIGDCLDTVIAGNTVFPAGGPSTATGQFFNPVLTERELQVLRLLADGMRVTDIARQLSLSVKTVSTHKVRLQDKLGALGTAQIVPRALAAGVLP